MASSLPPVKGAAFSCYVSVVSQADTDIFKTSVTLAAGDVTVSKDGGAFNNITTLPVEIGTSGVLAVALSATEMTADVVVVRLHDAAGDEWQDALVSIYTAAQTLDTTDGIADDIKATVNHVTYGNSALATLVGSRAAPGDAMTLAAGAVPTAGEMWSYTPRTLTSTAAATTAAVTGAQLAISITASYAGTISGLTIPATYTKIWFTLKKELADTDASAVLQIVVTNPAAAATDGVLYVESAAASVAQRTLGSLTINQSGGTVAIAIDETLTASLLARGSVYYDIKCRESGGACTILTEGRAAVSRTVTRAVV